MELTPTFQLVHEETVKYFSYTLAVCVGEQRRVIKRWEARPSDETLREVTNIFMWALHMYTDHLESIEFRICTPVWLEEVK